MAIYLDKFCGFHNITLTDRNGNQHDVKVPDAGDVITVPQEMEQSSATFESEDVTWGSGTTQKYINEIWVNQGKTYSSEHWAYITVGGQARYLVALVPTYGMPGDYVDIYVTNNGTQTVWPCIIGDSKDIWVDAGYSWSDGIVYGHDSAGKCNIIEVMSELSNLANFSIISDTGILDRLAGVTKVVNGGNIKDDPNGPVGLSGSYGNSNGGDTESETFAGAVTALFRGFWDSFCTLFENSNQNRDDVTVLYSFKKEDNGATAGYITPGGIQTQAEADALEKVIEEQWLHTRIHYGTGEYQTGPFAIYWSSPYNVLEPFQCTWWANGRASMFLEQYGKTGPSGNTYRKYPTQYGDGGDYYNVNKENGWFEYGQTPRANSIVSWSVSGGYGHVAYVEGVASDGIWISDAGSGLTWRGVHKIGLDGSDLSGYTLNGYIYLDSPK